MSKIQYTPAGDTFGRKVSLDYRTSFPFQGLQSEVKSNSPEVISSADEYFGIWSKLDSKYVDPIRKLLVNVIVHPGDLPDSKDDPFVYRAYENHFFAASGSNLYVVDIDKGLATSFITPEIASERERFSYEILLSIFRVLATGFDRGPIHAGAVVFNGRPLLFIGGSGTGKSTLCYACVRRGFRLLTDEVVFVSIRDGLRVWSGSHYIRLCPESVNHFPELADMPSKIQVSGKPKIVIDIKVLGSERISLSADNPVVFTLQRDDRESCRLEPISSKALTKALYESIEPGFDLNRQLSKVIRALASTEKYRLIVGRNPNNAIDLLLSLTNC